MGRLASYLQEEFERRCPAGWREHAFMRPGLARLAGFSPRADLCLQSEDGSRRLWVELEISRADPAANQVKFATAHLFEPFAPSKFFAYVMMGQTGEGSPPGAWPRGDGPANLCIPAGAPLFDGARARRHLVNGLGLQLARLEGAGKLKTHFTRWMDTVENTVTVHPDGPIVICLRPQR